MQPIFEGKLVRQLKEKSGWGDFINEVTDILRSRNKPWNLGNTKGARSGKDLDSDIAILLKDKNEKITKEQFQKERNVPATAIDGVWEALHKDKVLINKGDYSIVNPAFVQSMEKAIEEAKAEHSPVVPTDAKAKAPASDPAQPAASVGTPETTAPVSPSRAPRKPPVSVKDFERVVDRLKAGKTLWEDLKRLPDAVRAINAFKKKYGSEWEIVQNSGYAKLKKLNHGPAAPKTSSTEYSNMVNAEALRLMLMHRASIISPRVKSPLNEED